jgi:hypothetical protein
MSAMNGPADAPAPAPAPYAGAEPAPSRRTLLVRHSGLLLELGIVTAGVLIALSVDTVRVWRAHQSLAAEARATMLSEVEQNRKALADAMASLGSTQKTYIAALRDARGRLAGRPADTSDFNMNVQMAGLSSAAYATAEITGALGYMNYDDVRRFTSVYEAQRRYQSLQDQIALELWAVATPVLFGGDLSGARPQELEAFARGLEHMLARLLTLQGFGEGLRQSYEMVLDPK